MRKNLFLVTALTIGTAFASGGASGGGKNGGGGTTSATQGEVKTLSERIPAGGAVQVKYLITQPRPISSGGPKLATEDFQVFGVAVSSPLGTTIGAALWDAGYLSVSVVSPSADYGTALDYPFLTVVMGVPSSKVIGTTYPLNFPDTTFQTPTGDLLLTAPRPGTLTIGGSVSITNIIPGGGTWPAGTVVRILGTGFTPLTKITTKTKTSSAVYVSPTEMRLSLTQQVTMDQQPFTAANPDGSQVTYYSYLRGVPVGVPTRELLQRTDPIFPSVTTGYAVYGPLPALSTTQFFGFAAQNPTAGPIAVTLRHDRTGTTTSVTLPSLGRIVEDLSVLLGGIAISANDTITISATGGVQIVGLIGDEQARTVNAFLPAF